MDQGTLSVSGHYGKIKKLWEELNVLQPVPRCTCGVLKDCSCNAQNNFLTIVAQTKLIQFLMGLNEIYDNVRSQILVLDLLPTVNKALSMILRVEKQKIVQNSYSENLENSAMTVKGFQGGYGGGIKKRDSGKKDDKHCDFVRGWTY